MKKAVLISIRPEWCEKILSGEKTIEVRKTKPKLEPPFKCYIYETRTGYISKSKENDILVSVGFGKVIGEFTCDEIYEIGVNSDDFGEWWHETISEECDEKQMCLTWNEVSDYLGYSRGWGWHISDLKIYDYPKNLKEFTRPCNYYHDCFPCIHAITDAETNEFSGCDNVVETAPQSWCYVEELV